MCPSVFSYTVEQKRTLFPFLAHVLDRIKASTQYVKLDTLRLPVGLERNSINTAVRIRGCWQPYQLCAQLSSRFRLDKETARNCGMVAQGVKIMPVG
jgi:hypothetical protein